MRCRMLIAIAVVCTVWWLCSYFVGISFTGSHYGVSFGNGVLSLDMGPQHTTWPSPGFYYGAFGHLSTETACEKLGLFFPRYSVNSPNLQWWTVKLPFIWPLLILWTLPVFSCRHSNIPVPESCVQCGYTLLLCQTRCPECGCIRDFS